MSSLILFNKPIGIATTDERIFEYIDVASKSPMHAYTPLDEDTEGLVFFSADENLGKKLEHIEHEYEISIDAPLTKDARHILSRGMILDGKSIEPLVIKKEFNKGRRTIITFCITELRDNTLMRKMFETLGFHTQTLKRTRIGNAKLGVLPIGKTKRISSVAV